MGASTNIAAIAAEVAHKIPPYIQTIAVAHNTGIAIGLLCQRTGRRITAIEPDLPRAAALRQRFERVVPAPSALEESVDAAVLAPETEAEWENLPGFMIAYAAGLSPHGSVFLVVPANRDSGEIIANQHLVEFDRWSIPTQPEKYTVIVLHPRAYDRFAHAQYLADSGHPDWAVDLLADKEGRDPDEEHRRQKEMHRYLLPWDDRDGADDRLRRFFLSQSLFANVSASSPKDVEAFKTHAAMWKRLGDHAMSERLIRTLDYAQLGSVEARQAVAPRAEECAPELLDKHYRPRLLVMLEAQPDYGADVLFDGLADILGDNNVVDFPWKGTLHGEEPATQQHYPCMFQRPGLRLAFEDVLEQMAAGRFDGVLYCAHTNAWHGEDLKALTAASPTTPIYLVDQSDSPVNHREAMAAHVGASSDAPYFKREMLQAVDYGPNAFPLPFAYPSGRLKPMEPDRGIPLFWAGHRQFGLRRLYLEHIESLLGRPLDQQLTQADYAEQLANARIGLNFFGFGYDTVRYWELPAHGCMLLSERLPIRVPNNFVLGESAVFFDDLEELERRLVYYLERPEESAHIAQAGRVHLEQHHTGVARAKQFLARIQRLQIESATR